MLNREKIALSFIRSANRPVSRFQLMKWLFLFGQQHKLIKFNHFYKFVPYKYGPYSFTLNHELEKLINTSYISVDTKNRMSISEEIKAPAINGELALEISIFLRKHTPLTNKELTKKVYKTYPWFTVNALNPKLRLQKLPTAKKAVYTIGYESLLVDEFFDILLSKGIGTFIDIRNNPISRRFGFHKSTLSKICKNLKIDYHHFPKLGIPSALRTTLNTKEDYRKLFRKYKNNILATENKVVEEVTKLIETKPSVLACMEADFRSCHRMPLGKIIAEKTELPIIDLRK
jgi:uncharacterized protein (DUF488 family)